MTHSRSSESGGAIARQTPGGIERDRRSQRHLGLLAETSVRSGKKLLAVLLFAAFPLSAQEFAPQQVVFPITGFKPDIRYLTPFTVKFGTGFCLDPECRFVGTNYHVAKVMGNFVRIKGVFSAHRYLDSNANDVNAGKVNFAENPDSLRYTLAHDLAIYEMRRPLKSYHGIGFDSDEQMEDAQVDIYAYPFNWNPKRRLAHWQGNVVGKTMQGLLAFKYSDGQIHGGASGGIVVNSRTKKIVGILSAVGEEHGIALAVPTGELADFVARVQPYLQVALFPKTVFVSPVAADLYPPFIPVGRGEHSAATFKLRLTAQRLADSMRNFSATETFDWGEGNRQSEFSDAYETLIVDGRQRWRRPGSQKFYDEVPFPRMNNSIVSDAEWSYLPELLGIELNLNIHQAPDAIVGGRKIQVFQYGATAENKVCWFRSYFISRPWGSKKSYDCHGEVWLDESGIILRISQTLDLTGPWQRWWGVVTYGWLKKDGRRYLVPVTIATQAEHQKTYWCRGLFTDYEMFDVKSRMVTAAK